MPEIDVLCIGDLDVDMFVSVPAIPGFDQKIAGDNHGQMPGGMSANCAVAVARLGLRSRLVAAVGSDASGAFAIESLRAEGVDVAHVISRGDTNTFMCLVLIAPSGEKSLIKLETEAYLPYPHEITEDAFQDVRHLHVTYGRPELSYKALTIARGKGIATSLDLEPPDIIRNPMLLASVLPLVDTLFLNAEAYELASQALGERLGPQRLNAHGEVLVTLGARGCRRLFAGEICTREGFVIDALDTTGAGDCFAGAYLAAKLEGASPEKAMELANAAAALATTRIGAQTAMPSWAQANALIEKHKTARLGTTIRSAMGE
ncbi:carbohydrate kinase family protein [Nitratireductor sp. CH_MIT9313-5]|uniref:carbohydrate kinase family protein n=1 Tax=Nitratireductor sp. CH_MIT9313-5 TaxID=3107764 RepID=UPI0030099AFC